ncbi:hypothetical protein PCANC_02314 [Puccinia coronata f. sp. avenae]|uniref:Uncharacterized protein n=1 Tax=Puccinia coronata f. sp. avenae TaxID=200324 RepID=A0A2N5VZA3_9BASI|nr:hypothetical protein PCANC_02314 [Puccinia coronata f. sp. avenae]
MLCRLALRRHEEGSNGKEVLDEDYLELMEYEAPTAHLLFILVPQKPDTHMWYLICWALTLFHPFKLAAGHL